MFVCMCCCLVFFFFKQKTAYEMRISDWSSDVCSSDLPRLYSLASSLAAAPDEAHLTLAPVRYDLHGEARCGVASGLLADRAGPDTVLPVYIQSNPHFRLPGDDAPIIMIGAGTGVAPYRAFLQEREVRGAAGKSWLFFGERNFRSDFLYQTEWQDWLKDGTLGRMDVAFSRDGSEKIYVQHRMKEQSRSEEHTSELQSLMRISYAVFCLKKKNEIHPGHTALIHNTTLKH